jgi:hypothetical protein
LKLTELPSGVGDDPELQSSVAEAELVESGGRFAGAMVSAVFVRPSV